MAELGNIWTTKVLDLLRAASDEPFTRPAAPEPQFVVLAPRWLWAHDCIVALLGGGPAHISHLGPAPQHLIEEFVEPNGGRHR